MDNRTDGVRLVVVRPGDGEGADVIWDVTTFDPDVPAGLEGLGVDVEREIGREGEAPVED